MSVARQKRLLREVADCQKAQDGSGVTIQQIGDTLDKFVGTFPGPEGTPYEGGRFVVDIEAPPNYPFSPLKMKFVTKVYHPNVSSSTGFICLDILKTSWSPVFTLRTCLVSLQSLLSTPEPSDPQDAEVANHYLSDKKGFESTAKYWTQVYAADETPQHGKTSHSTSTTINSSTAVSASQSAKLAGIEWSDVIKFSEMGFDEFKVVEVLRFLKYRGEMRKKIDTETILEKLFAA